MNTATDRLILASQLQTIRTEQQISKISWLFAEKFIARPTNTNQLVDLLLRNN